MFVAEAAVSCVAQSTDAKFVYLRFQPPLFASVEGQSPKRKREKTSDRQMHVETPPGREELLLGESHGQAMNLFPSGW